MLQQNQENVLVDVSSPIVVKVDIDHIPLFEKVMGSLKSKRDFLHPWVLTSYRRFEKLQFGQRHTQTHQFRPHSRYDFEDMISFALLVNDDYPITFLETIAGQEKDKQIVDMIEEMESLHRNHTWKLDQFLEGKKAIGYKQVYKKKSHYKKKNVEDLRLD